MTLRLTNHVTLIETAKKIKIMANNKERDIWNAVNRLDSESKIEFAKKRELAFGFVNDANAQVRFAAISAIEIELLRLFSSDPLISIRWQALDRLLDNESRLSSSDLIESLAAFIGDDDNKINNLVLIKSIIQRSSCAPILNRLREDGNTTIFLLAKERLDDVARHGDKNGKLAAQVGYRQYAFTLLKSAEKTA